MDLGFVHCAPALRPFVIKNHDSSYHLIGCYLRTFRLHRRLLCHRSHNPGYTTQIQRCASEQHSKSWAHDGSMDCPFLHPSLRTSSKTMVACNSRRDSHPYQCRICCRRPSCWLDTHPESRKLLLVSLKESNTSCNNGHIFFSFPMLLFYSLHIFKKISLLLFPHVYLRLQAAPA